MMINLSGMRKILLLAALSVGFLQGCFHDEEEEGSDFHCSYEVGSSACGGGAIVGGYTQECTTFNTANFVEGWDIANHCQNTYTDGYHSGGSSCVVYFDYRNVQQLPGACPGGTGNLATIGGADSELSIEARWTGGGVDLEVLTPTRKLVASQSPEADGCTFSGDDRYVLNGPVESVQCRGVNLAGGYNVILSNHTAENAVVTIKVTKNGNDIYTRQVTVVSDEPQSTPVSVQ